MLEPDTVNQAAVMGSTNGKEKVKNQVYTRRNRIEIGSHVKRVNREDNQNNEITEKASPKVKGTELLEPIFCVQKLEMGESSNTVRYNPFEIPDQSKYTDFLNWYINTSSNYMLDYMRVPLRYNQILEVSCFDNLMSPTAKLSNFDIDMVMNLIMYRARENPELFRTRWTCVEYLAWKRMGEMDRNFGRMRMEGYVRGRFPVERPIHWAAVDYIYGVAHVPTNHWVLYVIDLHCERIVVYDSLLASSKAVKDEFNNLSKFVPWICAREGVLEAHVGGKKCKTQWDVVFYETTPQQETGYDCGLMALKFFECLAAGIPVENVNPSSCTAYREEYLVSLWKLKQ